MTIDISLDKHAKYFNRVLGILPSQYEKEDSNKLAIIYFAVNSLSLMNRLDIIKPAERITLINQIYDTHLLASGDGFRGSGIYKLDSVKSEEEEEEEYDPANLAATFFALNILFILKDESITRRIDRNRIMRQVKRCQLANGAFCPMLDKNGNPCGDTDLRYCMIAATIRLFLQYGDDEDDDIDLINLENCIIGSKSYDGGMGGSLNQESHSGLTFCGLSTLKLIGVIDNHNWDDTVDYLVHRQIPKFDGKELEYEYNDEDDYGGFQGRLNKYGDTCYGFWCLGSLKLITDVNLIDEVALLQFLSQTQNKLMGGFNKTTDPDDRPDPLHSFLGLVCLSMLNGKKNLVQENQLQKFDVIYMTDESVVGFIKLQKWL